MANKEYSESGMKNVFALQDIIVTNEQGARKYGLVR